MGSFRFNGFLFVAITSAIFEVVAPPPAWAQGGVAFLDHWRFGSEKNGLDDSSQPYAAADDHMGDGGTVTVASTCTDGGLHFDFEYHAKIDSQSRYQTGSNASFVHILYRLDNGPIVAVNSATAYRNSAGIDFAFQDPAVSTPPQQDSNGPRYPELVPRAYNKSLYESFLPQDLRRLLHAHEARFELPLNDRGPEVIKFDPQNAALRRLKDVCHIDLAGADAAASKQAALEKEAAKRTAAEAAAKKASEQAKQIEADLQISAVKHACLVGGIAVKSTDRTYFADGSDHKITMVWLKKGEILQTLATPPDIVASQLCHVAVNQDGIEHTGSMATGFLAAE